MKLRSFLEKEGKSAIIGLGNIYRMDDGAGIVALRLLKEKIVNKAKNVFFIEAGRRLINQIYSIVDLNPIRIIFIDSSNFGANPGSVKLLRENQIIEGNISIHENNFNIVLDYLKKKISNCQILFIGIQFERLEMTDKIFLTENVRKGVIEIVRTFEDCF